MRSLFTRGKGKLEVTFEKRAYNPGDQIDVQLHLSTKKELGPGRLFATLVCEERVTTHSVDSDGDRDTDTRINVIYSHEVDAAIEASFPASTEEDFTLTFEVPPDPTATNVEIPGWIGGLVKAASFFGNKDSRLTWYVVGRYDIKGLDLVDKEKISINIG